MCRPYTFAAATALIFLLWGTGQVFRDSWVLTALCFYLPSPLAAAWLALAACAGAWRRRWVFTAACCAACTVTLAAVFVAENQWRKPAAPLTDSPPVRAVHWNIWYGKLGWKGVLERIADVNADVYVLSEWWPPSDPAEVAAILGPEYSAKRFFDIAVIARGTLGPVKRLSMPRGNVFVVPWRFQGGTYRLMAVDLPSNPLISRGPLLRALNGHITERQPDLVLGDFNTPRRARAFDVLPTGYAHAYTAAGAGWSYTWPSPLPVLAIDHCFTGPRVVATAYGLETSRVSDHCMQVVDFVATP